MYQVYTYHINLMPILHYNILPERKLAEYMLLGDMVFSFAVTLYVGIRTSIPFKKNVSVDINGLFRNKIAFYSLTQSDPKTLLKYINNFTNDYTELSDIFRIIESYIKISEHDVTFYIESCIKSIRHLTKLHVWMKCYSERKNMHHYFNTFISKLGDDIFHNILCREMINSDIIKISSESFMKFYKEDEIIDISINQSLLVTRFMLYMVTNNPDLVDDLDLEHWKYIFYGNDTQCYISGLTHCHDISGSTVLTSYDILYEFIRYYVTYLPPVDIHRVDAPNNKINQT